MTGPGGRAAAPVDEWNDRNDCDLRELICEAARGCQRRVPEPEETRVRVKLKTVRDVVAYLEQCPRIAGQMLLIALAVSGCGAEAPNRLTSDSARRTASVAQPVDSGFARAPDSAWVSMNGPTIVAFYPVVSNDSLARDEGLAASLDDLSYHLGSAMDSLMAAGMAVQYRGGDTLWLRSGSRRHRFVRATDSATVGYLFADTLGRTTALYGVRSHPDLLDYARAFKRTGTIAPR